MTLVTSDGRTLPRVPLGTGDTVVVDSLPPRELSVALDDVAPSCSVVAAVPGPLRSIARTAVLVDAGALAAVGFLVECGVLPPGRIAFVFTPDGVAPDVYLMNTDGSGLTRVTSQGGSGPAWSPDGLELAFSCAEGGIGLCLSNEDGSGLHHLTSDSGFAPVWSSDGSRIAYQCEDRQGAGLDLCVVGSDGAGRVNLTGGIGFNTSPSWSPDGSQLVFGRSLGPGSTLEVVRPDGSDLQQLTDDSLAVAPAWSPTGEFIAYSNDGVVRVRSDGTDPTRLSTSLRGPDGAPVWSPDGSRIAFDRLARKNSNFRDLWVMDADGGNPLQVIPFPGERPAWSPDGMHLAFTVYEDGNLYSTGIDGSHITTLKTAEYPGFAGQPAWQPSASAALQSVTR